jgi:hypothetical protein
MQSIPEDNNMVFLAGIESVFQTVTPYNAKLKPTALF